jgi:hypothetical protein
VKYRESFRGKEGKETMFRLLIEKSVLQICEDFIEICSEAILLHEKTGKEYNIFRDGEQVWSTGLLYEDDKVIYHCFVKPKMALVAAT